MLHCKLERNGFSVCLALFRDVKNAKDIKQHVMNGELEMTLLNTKMVTDPFQVLVAANRAVCNQRQARMTTKNVHSEVLFCLSPLKNISDSFRKFGMSDSADSVFVVIVNDTEDKTLHRLIEIIDGQQVAVSDVKHFCDETLVKKMFKVTDEELSVCSLTDALVSKIASKEFVTV
ncbi:EKC/KEOPS complex subunit TPRKB-like [Dreissena polymorpha]|uniref:Uncharacterized protein n=1 Tax=Dreissena polymorpha TaxID=45954 RepID=A0A9D4GQP6_DREPO|nr:EKC/KEOPS complex subunit TPRKB-like [Dreissena polymorpha]KAH3819794.1 hypothetical protein DPMN_121538 [Dreissena polymorpha]